MWFSRTWVGDKYYAIKAGVPSLIKWWKIVWEDRDYDYHFIYSALRFKLENTANYIEKHQRSVGWEHDVKWMRICVRLIDKISDDYYIMKHYDEIEKQWGKSDFKFTPIEDKLDDDGEKYFEMNMEYENAKTPEDYKKIDEMSSKGRETGQEQHEKAKRLLFKIMQEKIEYWWD
jgi:hypothetical protein